MNIHPLGLRNHKGYHQKNLSRQRESGTTIKPTNFNIGEREIELWRFKREVKFKNLNYILMNQPTIQGIFSWLSRI